ncbi:fatty acid oxidation complex subunit alpha FadJ [Aliivibrio fischeri]|uniref:fatty acid oxidation complex subunit alpha FadJ n=1 Tax=Aliivibrio fischeri TaxID=668 RepID=UPI0012DA9050|nr:fatty acid oxidation complex subunit alpha FadJ [Aliivibrio fischeri]MUJ29947.1 fatty acid oxidation complex subunit alpha FadJ [Aliivibrio fischeri]
MTLETKNNTLEAVKNTSAFAWTKDDDQIAWLTIDVPNEKMNTLQAAFAEQVAQVLDEIEEQQAHIKGLVIQSGKPDNFIAGADINMIANCQNASEAQVLAEKGQQLFQRIEDLPFATVAAIHGPCLGGGLELALACDYRVCSDDNKTKLGLPEVQLGLLPGSGGTQRLPRLIGLLPSLDIILTGKQLRPKKALKLGVVDASVPHTILSRIAADFALKKKAKRKLSAKEWGVSRNPLGRNVIFSQAEKQAQKKARGNYPAIAAILDSIEHGLDKGMKKGLQREAEQFARLAMTPESAALRSLFFAMTEMKKEKGSDAEPKSIDYVGVLGGGLMGGGIAHVSIAKAKKKVTIKDINNDGLLNAYQYHYQRLDTLRKRRIISKAQLQQQMLQLTGVTEFDGFKKLDVVVEAVFEDLNLKQEMVKAVQEQGKEDVIFATNTSSLPIGQIAEGAQKPENIVGLHYFSPVEKMPLVEVIPHATTSYETISTVVALAKQQGKTPIVVKDSAGFYVNRILAPYMNEAARLLLAGEPIEVLDEALLDFGFPVGPISLLDEVGVDIGAKIMPILEAELGDRFRSPDVFQTLIDDKRLGKKTKRGFYVYKGKKKEPDQEVYTLLNIKPQSQLSKNEIAMRCVLPMLAEAKRCLDEGIIASERDGDIGAIFGIGFPPFLGGPFTYMNTLGEEKLATLMRNYADKYGDRFIE